MFVFAGIDEAGYGPMFGPLVVGRFVFGLEGAGSHDKAAQSTEHRDAAPDLWAILEKAVCRNLKSARRGRIAINDSKKLYTSREGKGLSALEMGVLTFAALAKKRPRTLDHWLDLMGENAHHNLSKLPWYEASEARPWNKVPKALTEGQVAVARSMLAATARQVQVKALDVGARVVFEDRFNEMVGATRSKAATSFTFVADHLQNIWRQFGEQRPLVIVDRQSGRTHYRGMLAINFPHEKLTVEYEDDTGSAYTIESKSTGDKQSPRAMTIRFEVDADAHHMPVALASMVSKYTRELLMARFQAWFTEHAPQIKPTAGYARDAARFWKEIQPTLNNMTIEPDRLRRRV